MDIWSSVFKPGKDHNPPFIDYMASKKMPDKIGMQFIGEGIRGDAPVKGDVSFRNIL